MSYGPKDHNSLWLPETELLSSLHNHNLFQFKEYYSTPPATAAPFGKQNSKHFIASPLQKSENDASCCNSKEGPVDRQYGYHLRAY
jgi:hypothetical protein